MLTPIMFWILQPRENKNYEIQRVLQRREQKERVLQGNTDCDTEAQQNKNDVKSFMNYIFKNGKKQDNENS